MEQMLTTSEAASLLRRHVKTVQRWDRSGLLKSERTPSGRRLYKKSTIESFLGNGSETINRKIIAYCRVSSQAQKPDLKNQREAIEQFCLSSAKANVEYIEEIGGGLNFKRKKFLELIDLINSGEISEIIIAHKDRLARFGFDLLQHICDKNNTFMTVINIEKLSPEQEMVQDLMTIIHCFSSRLYGLRNYKKIVKEALKKNDN
jgi:predicted site-specific integrase-resolvase